MYVCVRKCTEMITLLAKRVRVFRANSRTCRCLAATKGMIVFAEAMRPLIKSKV